MNVRRFGQRVGVMMSVALAAIATLAHAQPTPKREPLATITNVRLGWGDLLPAERWSPVWIDVRGGQNAFEGTLTLSYVQDGTQGAEIVLPIATTPGQTVPFEMAVCPPRNISALTLTIRGSGYKREYEIDTVASRAPWSLPRVGDGRLVLVVGECSAADAFEAVTLPGDGEVSQTMSYWDMAEGRPWSPSELPLGWRAYESVDAVVARAEDVALAEPRARDALMTWVEGGGRLVIVADAAGDRWMDCVGPAVARAAPSARVTPHASWSGRTTGEISARVITLTDAGRADGWETFWPLADGVGMLGARGPVGCGMVTLLGVEPERVPALVSKVESRRVWRPVFDGEHGIIATNRRTFELDPNRFWASSSGTDQKAMTAIRTGLDAIAGVAAIGDGAFIVIAAAVLLLAGLLGPFDWFVMRKRGWSRWSWATASLWILGASAAALVAPMVIRADLSTVSRARVVDVVDDGGRRGAWTTGLSAVFSGGPEVVDFGGVEGSWWRGVSPVMVSPYESSGSSFSPVRTVMRGSEARGAAITPLPQGQWTFRTVLEQRPGSGVSPELPGVMVQRTVSGFGIELRGVPAGATVRTGGLRVKQGAVGLEFVEAENEKGQTVWVADARSDQLRRTDEVLWGPRAAQPQEVWSNNYYYGDQGLAWPASAMDLPGVAERSDAAEARVRVGTWANVLVEVEGGPDEGLPKVKNASARTVLVLRACVPVNEGDGEP